MTFVSCVENYVEIGDFFLFFASFLTKSSEKMWISWSMEISMRKIYRIGQYIFVLFLETGYWQIGNNYVTLSTCAGRDMTGHLMRAHMDMGKNLRRRNLRNAERKGL